ncbi:MAG: MFS transporter [Pseudomonadota bacterium]
MSSPPEIVKSAGDMADPSLAGDAAQTDPEADAGAQTGVFGLAGLSWAVFEAARNPYYNMIVIYLFAPYFANVLVGGDSRGLELSGWTITIAGIATAMTAPFLGVVADKAGRRKPPIAVFLFGLGACAFLLWWAKPDGEGFGVYSTMAILAIAYCCYGYSEVLHNAMLPMAGRRSALPMISGMGLAMGNVVSVGMILFFMIALLLPGQMDMPFIPAEPLFGIDQAAHEPERLAGPFVAVWLAIVIIPFFLFMPDGAPGGLSWKAAAADVFQGESRHSGNADDLGDRLSVLGAYLRSLFKDHPQAMRFLIARTIYADAMAALLTLGAVFAGTFIGFNQVEILIFGILGLVFGAIGGFVGGYLDGWLGPKRALIVELTALIILLTIQLSITRESLFFGMVPADHQVWNSPFFDTLADVTYAALILPVAIAVVACISSSRYMLVHTAPKERIGEFFGLYAIAGTVTVWMGPGLVSLLTFLTGNQRIGMAGIGVMFAIGLAVLFTVRSDTEDAAARSGRALEPAE